MKPLLAFSFLFLVFILGAFPAHAAGYAVKEQSSSGQGNSFAGMSAGGEDISAMFFNPASLSLYQGSQAVLSLSYIMPQGEFSDGAASNKNGATTPGTAHVGDNGVDAAVPALYMMWQADENWRFGFGLNAPFGLETDYDSNWVGRYHAINSKLSTMNANPVVSWRVNDVISLAAGLQVQRIFARLSNAIDFSTINNQAPGLADGKVTMRGTDWGMGWTAGVLIQPREDIRLGVGYRSQIAHKLKGDTEYELSATGATLKSQTGRFTNSGISASAETPQTLSFGAAYDVTPQWTLLGEASWTRWSQFSELRIKSTNPNDSDSVTDERWEDSWFFALGATYRWNDEARLRFGLARDFSPVPDEYRTPRIPDSSRTWLSAGFSYDLRPNMVLDMGYSHIIADDAGLYLKSSGVGNTNRGNLTGDYDSVIDIITAQAIYRF